MCKIGKRTNNRGEVVKSFYSISTTHIFCFRAARCCCHGERKEGRDWECFHFTTIMIIAQRDLSIYLPTLKKYHIALLIGGIQQRRRVQKIMRNVCRTKVLCNTNRYSAFLTSFSGNPQIADGLCANPEKTDNIVIQQTSRHIRRKKCWIFRTLLPKRNQVSIAPNRKDMWVINEFSTNILNYQRNHLYAK